MPDAFVFEKRQSSTLIFVACCGAEICKGWGLPEVCHKCLGRVSKRRPACICEEYAHQLEVLAESNHDNLPTVRKMLGEVFPVSGEICDYLTQRYHLYDGNKYFVDVFDTGPLFGTLHGGTIVYDGEGGERVVMHGGFIQQKI